MRLAMVIALLACLLAPPALLAAPAQAEPPQKVVLVFPQSQELPMAFMKAGEMDMDMLLAALKKYNIEEMVLSVQSAVLKGNKLLLAVNTKSKGGFKIKLEPR